MSRKWGSKGLNRSAQARALETLLDHSVIEAHIHGHGYASANILFQSVHVGTSFEKKKREYALM